MLGDLLHPKDEVGRGAYDHSKQRILDNGVILGIGTYAVESSGIPNAPNEGDDKHRERRRFASIGQRVDLNLITKNFVDVEYYPDRFPGLVFRLKSPKTATLVFSSGKMVCTGAKSEEQSRKAVAEVVRRLRKGGIPIKNEAEVVIQNMVASANLGGRIHLEEAARQLPKSMYEPEQFPGLVHRMPDPKTVILLFSSGKLVCTGARKEGDVYRAVNNLHVMPEEKGLMIY